MKKHNSYNTRLPKRVNYTYFLCFFNKITIILMFESLKLSLFISYSYKNAKNIDNISNLLEALVQKTNVVTKKPKSTLTS